MTECLTSSQIEAHLQQVIACHPGCRGFQIEVRVRRDDPGAHDGWHAEFYATGDIGCRKVCEDALLDILADAQEDYTLSLDS